MTTYTFYDVLENPDEYVSNILERGFSDFFDGVNTFKNVVKLEPDYVTETIEDVLDLDLVLSFARQSPENQEEPNFIHKDDMHGEYTAILYLNKVYPSGYGTTLYDDDENPILVCKGKYNSLFIFPSSVKHSRNILQNFGEGDNARLVQVMFFKILDDEQE